MNGIDLKTCVLWSGLAACAVAQAQTSPDPAARLLPAGLAYLDAHQERASSGERTAAHREQAAEVDLGYHLDQEQRLAIGLRALGVKAVFTLQP